MRAARSCSRRFSLLRAPREPHETFIDGLDTELLLQLGGCPKCRDLPVDHDRDAVTVLGFVHVVSRHESCRAVLGRPVYQLPELTSSYRVDAAGRLVEEDDP